MKRLIALASVLLMCAGVMAQVSPCPGLKNPASFTAGSTSGLYVGYYTGQTGTKPSQAPNALTGVTGVNMTSPILTASQLATTTDNGTASYCGSSLDASNEFRIMSTTDGPGTGSQAGKDPLVSYQLPYCATSYDPTITKSIRLGNCQVSAHAEALYYNMDVRVENALLFIYYSIVVQAPGHGAAGDPSFVIRVAKQNSSGQWVQISDTLCYAVSSTGLVSGTNGWHSYNGSGGNGFYRDWNKVAINLNDYIYETVRVEIYMGDCSASGHYGYCYVSGDCQAMSISTSGCPAGATTTVQTLTAPSGLDNYAWYKCNTNGTNVGSLTSIPASVTWTALPANPDTSYVYHCQISDFMVTEGEGAGNLTNNAVFRCDMTSAMDPAKPFTSNVYVRVLNTKPLMSIDSLKSCDGDLNLTCKSYVPNDMDGCDTSVSKWWFYSGANASTPVVDSALGGRAWHRYDTTGVYAVKVRSFNSEDHSCYSDSTYTIFALGRPTPMLEPSAREVCDSEVVVLEDRTAGAIRRDWILHHDDGPNDTIWGPRRNATTTYQHIFEDYKNPVEMRTYNGLFCRDSINTYDTIWCTASAFDTIEVFKHPELTVTGDTVVCNGQQTDITVATETEGCTYRWFRHLGDPNSAQLCEGQTLRVLPYDDTCKYYVKVISRTQCEAWDSVNAYRVNPTLSINRHDMCEGDRVTLTADRAYTYSWTASPADSSLNELLDSAGHGPAEITVQPKETTVYTLVGHGTNDCNSDPLTEQITVHPIPEATVDYYPNFVDSDNPVVTLTDVSPYSVHRVWYFEDGIGEEIASPCSHNFGEVSADSVNITMVAYNDLECSDTINFRLPVTQFTFYAPNAFTPERPDNSYFSIYTANEQENFSVYIYDRAGRQVYTSNDLHFRWNGTTVDGTKCPQGTYVFVVTYRRPGTEDIVQQKGAVTLIR